jgi:hypothetical protein
MRKDKFTLGPPVVPLKEIKAGLEGKTSRSLKILQSKLPPPPVALSLAGIQSPGANPYNTVPSWVNALIVICILFVFLVWSLVYGGIALFALAPTKELYLYVGAMSVIPATVLGAFLSKSKFRPATKTASTD